MRSEVLHFEEVILGFRVAIPNNHLCAQAAIDVYQIVEVLLTCAIVIS